MIRRLKSITSYILLNNIFIAFCAVGLCINTSIVLQVPIRDVYFYGFIFNATLFTYNVYYLKDLAHPHAKLLAAIGIIFSVFFFALCDLIPVYELIFISILSALYILPGYIGIKRTKSYLIFKFILLVVVWTHTTLLLPLKDYTINPSFILLYCNRFIFLWNLSMLFFIKDEESKFKKNLLVHSLYFTIFIQLIISIWYTYTISIEYGLVYILMSLVLMLLGWYFIKYKKSQLYYLFFVDGIMLLETIFVLLLQISFQD